MCCFIVRIIDFLIKFWKILEFSLKKIEILEIQNIFRIPSFTICFFNFLVFLTFFFLVYLSMVFIIFVFFYCMDLRFYQKIMQNYGFFSKKIGIFEIQNFETNSIVYCFFFIFLAFLVFCFLSHLSKLF